MNFNFQKTTEDFLKIIAKTAQQHNVRVFFVGGIVRDYFLNKETDDIDLILEGNAINFSKKLSEEIKVKSIHKDFGTVKLEYKGLNVDLASTRIEHYPYCGCLPYVDEIGVTIEQDVKRRDFTINSMYCEITVENKKLNYKFIDLIDGMRDLKEKKLKILHKKSYFDDPTRILRGLNFKYRFGFDFSDDDKILINNAIDNINLENASIDRIKEVLKKVLRSDFQDEIFCETVKNKYYTFLFKEVDVDFKKLKRAINNFKMNKEEKAQLYFDVLSNETVEISEFSTKIDEYKFYSKLPVFKRAFLYYKTQNENIILYSNTKLYTTGKVLLDYNYPEGKIIGKILDKLLLKKLENPEQFCNSDQEVQWVLNNFPKK